MLLAGGDAGIAESTLPPEGRDEQVSTCSSDGVSMGGDAITLAALVDLTLRLALGPTPPRRLFGSLKETSRRRRE